MPTESRETACVLVRSDDSALLLDAGTGVRRLATQPTLIEGATRLDVSAFERAEFGQVHELVEGAQQIGAFTVMTRAQLRHWAPTAGLRVDDDLALITDTAYDPGAVPLVRGVKHLLHEAWSPSNAPRSVDGDATGRDAARVAAAAEIELLTLIHLNPLLSDHRAVLDDARVVAPDTRLGEDAQVLE